MRAVVQRVLRASVQIIDASIGAQVEVPAWREVSAIEKGLLILLGVRTEDTETDARALADKIANLRIFEDEAGKLNRSVREVGGSALVVSNFTLYGDCRKGRRPSFTEAAPGPLARALYETFGRLLAEQDIPVRYGAFGEEMQVSLTNDGPVTLLLDSPPGERAERS